MTDPNDCAPGETSDINVDVGELELSRMVIGIQRCAACGHQGIYAWPLDSEDGPSQCAACFEMASSGAVFYPLADFPGLRVYVVSRRAFQTYDPARRSAPKLRS